jgi:hypothetical protein
MDALHKQQWDVGQVCRLLNVGEVEANDQFVQQTRKILKDAKIYAEIQLVFYCELEASRLPPRVFYSTKDAYFVMLPFKMYGKIYTPRCHGRLYPGWQLPLFPRLQEIEQGFNRELANHIRNSLTTLLSRQQKTVYPDPHESTLLTLPVSMSTLRSLALPEAEKGELSENQAPNHSETDQILLNLKKPWKPSEKTSSSPTPRTGDVLIQPSNDNAPKMSKSTWEPSSNSISVESYILVQG